MRIFGIVSAYGLLIALAILAGVYLCGFNERRLSLPDGTALDMALYAVPAGIIGARLYYVAFQWDYYRSAPWTALYVWEGGLAIYGGIIGGALAVWWFAKRRRVPFGLLADMTAPSLLLGQAIGRWGNFLNSEAYGRPVTDPALQFFPYAVKVAEGWVQAAFFYESAADLAGFAILWLTRKRWRKGDGMPLYLILYGVPRFLIEGLRADSLYLGGTGIRISQALSLLLVLAGATHFLYTRLRRPAPK